MMALTEKIIECILLVPKGKVTSYGLVAKAAGSPLASRAVAYVLHSQGKKLPWFRVCGTGKVKGKLVETVKISLGRGAGFEEQKALLEAEGVVVSNAGSIDFKLFGYDFL